MNLINIAVASLAIGLSQVAMSEPLPNALLLRGTTPETDPKTWVERGDAPKAAREIHLLATLQFTLHVNMAGRVSECIVDQSTGYIELDNAICEALKRRARFIPARNNLGDPAPGTYHSRVILNL